MPHLHISFLNIKFQLKIYDLFYNFHSRNKRGMLVIAPEVSDNIIVRYLKPLQNEKLPDGITFNVVAGKKCMIL